MLSDLCISINSFNTFVDEAFDGCGHAEDDCTETIIKARTHAYECMFRTAMKNPSFVFGGDLGAYLVEYYEKIHLVFATDSEPASVVSFAQTLHQKCTQATLPAPTLGKSNSASFCYA